MTGPTTEQATTSTAQAADDGQDQSLTVDVLGPDGTRTGSLALPPAIFDVPVNIPLIHQVVVAQLAAARQGTHDTKTRAEVAGGGKKPYRQKGTGRARQGSIRAPQFAGGGVVHGPTPRSYAQRTPKKMKAAALRGALSDRARAGRVHIVESLLGDDMPSTRAAVTALRHVSERRRALVVMARDDDVTRRSLRNAPSVHLLPVDQLNTYDVLLSEDVVFTRAAYDAFVSRLDDPTGASEDHMSRLHKDHRDVLVSPVVSEKSYGLLDQNKYTFVVLPDANKTEIKIAVEQVFGVKVTAVNTINRTGKRRRTRTGWGKRPDTKRAVVSVAEGQRIDIFSGPGR